MNSLDGGPFLLESRQLREAAIVLARAFQDEPLFTYAIPDPGERRTRLPHFMQFELRHAMLYGEVYAPSPALEGIAGWLPSDRAERSIPALLRSGVLSLLRHGGIRAANRMRHFEDAFTAMWRRHARFPHCVLEVLGVDPGHQGHGHAGMLIQAMLHRLDRESVPICLGTSTTANVSFYRQFGFEVAEESTLPGTGVSIWLMIRQPAATGTSPQSVAARTPACGT